MATSSSNSPPPPPPPPSLPSSTDAAVNGVSVVVVPLPAQGHLSQFLHLSHLLAARGLSVHFVGSACHNRQARDRYGAAPSSPSPIHFHDLPLPPFPSPPPSPNSSFLSHLQPAFAAVAAHFPSPLSSFLRSLAASSRRVILLHDSTMSFAAAAAANASLPNLSSFAVHTVSAYALLHFLRESRGASLPHSNNSDDDDIRRDDCFSPDFLAFLRSQHGMIPPNSCRLLNTCRAIEGEFVDLLAKEPAWSAQKTYAIGPLNPTAMTRVDGGRRHDCLKWLDTQQPGSVLYVSFGTTSSLPKEQTAELAAGLEAAGVPFVWAVRGPDRANIYENNGDDDDDDDDDDNDVSREFERRVAEWGRVERGWAPQEEVLRHGSTGGFMSHCGWNSCMESMSAGVPMLTWPMHSDQPRNAQLVARVLGAGAAAREWAARGRVVAAAAIRDAVVAFMLGDVGAAARRRARLVGDQLRTAAGRSGTDFEAFVANITN